MKRLLIFILLLLGIVFGAAGFLSSTQGGLKWLFARIERFIPGEFSIESLDGRLVGPIEITGLRYHTEEITVDLDHLILDWKPADLLFLKADITAFHAEGLKISIKEKKKVRPAERKKPADIRIPVHLMFEDARIRGISILRSGSEAPWLIDEVSMRAGMGPESISIEEIRVSSSRFTAGLKGKLNPHGDYPMDLGIEWTGQPHGFARIKGQGEIKGTLKELRVVHELDGPSAARLQGTLRDILDSGTWEATLTVRKFPAGDLHAGWPQIVLGGELKGQGGFSDFDLAGSLTSFEPRFGNVSWDVSLKKRNETWQVEKLILSVPEQSTRLEARGEYAPVNGTNSFKLEGGWRSLSWPLTGKDSLVKSSKGEVSIQGTPEDYRIDLTASVSGKGIPSGDWILSGRGSRSGLSIGALHARVLKGELSGKGEVSWEPRVAWDLALNGKGLDPGAAWPEWKGNLSVDAACSGSVDKGKPKISLDIRQLKGQMRGHSFRARSLLGIEGDQYTLSGLELTSGSARITASGTIAENWDVKWDIHAANLADLAPGGKGMITGQGSLAGPRRLPRIIARLDAQDAGFGRYEAGKFKADMDIDFLDRQDSRLDIGSKGILMGTHQIDSLSVKGRGKVSAHEVTLKMKKEEDLLDLRIEGSFRDNRWSGLLKKADLSSEAFGSWILGKPGAFTLSSGEAAAGPWCWSREDAAACIHGERHGQRDAQLEVSLADLPLSTLNPLLPRSTVLQGKVSGRSGLQYSKEKGITGELTLQTSPGALNYTTGMGKKISLGFAEGKFDAILSEQAFTAKAGISTEDEDYIRSELTLPGFSLLKASKENQPVHGYLRARMKSLNLIPAFIPAIENISGAFNSDLTCSGTLQRPVVTGGSSIEHGALNLPDIGIRLKDVGLSVLSDGNGALGIEGKAGSGEGTIRIDGETQLKPEEGWPIVVSIQGTNFEAVKTPEAKVVVSPDLKLMVRGYRADLEGKLIIPRANLAPRDLAGTARVSKDIVIVNGSGETKEEKKWKIYSKVRLVLGDQVKFDGFGLSGDITGDITAVDVPGKLTAGTGELQVMQGLYKAYGQKLKIEKGRLVFSGGSIDNPGLDVRATRRTGDVIAGVNVRGTLKDPQLDLFSTPAMDQGDALSYLLFGRPMRQASGAEGQQLYNAALSLGLSGGEKLAKRIGSLFGLEQLEVEGGVTPQESVLVIGKYLSPRLYISYGIGLFEPISTVRTRYQVSRKWLVQTELGIQSGADLLYKIER